MSCEQSGSSSDRKDSVCSTDQPHRKEEPVDERGKFKVLNDLKRKMYIYYDVTATTLNFPLILQCVSCSKNTDGVILFIMFVKLLF